MGFTGAVTWDPTNPGACKVDINVPVSQLQVDAPEMRKKVGYDTVLDDSQRADVTKNMLSDEQLDGAKFSNITFKATKCEGAGDSVKVSGNLTIHGVSKSVTVPMKISAGDTISAKGSLHILASDDGFQPYSALLGQLKNQNDMTLTIDVVGAR
jgi:polyisoprenoid-binding protein YceI